MGNSQPAAARGGAAGCAPATCVLGFSAAVTLAARVAGRAHSCQLHRSSRGRRRAAGFGWDSCKDGHWWKKVETTIPELQVRLLPQFLPGERQRGKPPPGRKPPLSQEPNQGPGLYGSCKESEI